MQILIPTRGRVNRQTTWDELTPALRERAFLVCPLEEKKEHLARGRQVIVSPVEGIIAKRQWIMDNASSPRIAMLDDDLIFLKRKHPDEWNLARCQPSEVEQLFTEVGHELNDHDQVGVSPRQGNNRFFPYSRIHNNRVTNFHAYNVEAIRKLGIRFHEPGYPASFTMEDFHVTLSLLRAGHPNTIITDYAWDQHGSNSQGGCSLYRNNETQRQSALLLAQRHPGFVRVTQKKTKGGWEGVAGAEGRTDVVISWKKAFDSSRG